MKTAFWSFLVIAISLAFNVVQYYQISKLEYLSKFSDIRNNLSEDEIRDLARSANQANATAEDLNRAREAGKIDGKIEALLLMSNNPVKLTQDQINVVLESATSATKGNLESNFNFLSLLSQASFHKGLHSGLEQAEEMASTEYEKGYHKALEDANCPPNLEQSKPKTDVKKQPPIVK